MVGVTPHHTPIWWIGKMFNAELKRYCERHGYTIIETYTTLGDGRGSHVRAVVATSNGERHYLYYDPSRRRPKGPTTFRKEYTNGREIMLPTTPLPKARGWRNTTLDNRRRKERQEQRQRQYLSELLDTLNDE